jgi:hypothetical protein
VRFKTTKVGFFETNFFCNEPFGLLIIPATLRSNTIVGGVGATQVTLIGTAIDKIFPSEGQMSTVNRLRKPELSMTHVCHHYILLPCHGRRIEL